MPIGEPQRTYVLLQGFEKDPGDALIGEWELRGAPLDALRRHFGVPDNESMTSPIGPDDIAAVEPYLQGHTIDLERGDYFVTEVADYW